MRLWATTVVLVFMFPIVVAAPSMAGDADWPQRRADNQNTGAIGYGGGGTGELGWGRSFTPTLPDGQNPRFTSACGVPAIGNGIVFVCSTSYRDTMQGDRHGRLTAFDAKSGEALWGYEATHGSLSPLVASGLVYIETPTGMVALDVATGALEWEVDIDGRGRGATFSDGVLYFSTLGETPGTYAVDAKTGEILWQFPRRSHPVVVENDFVILSYSSGIDALDAGTGDLVWEKIVHSYSKPAIWDGVSVWTSRQDVLAVDLVSGEELWRANLSQFSATGSGPMPVIYEGVVYVAMNWAVSGYDVHSGDVVVEEEWGFSLWDDPVVIDGRMYLLSQENTGRSGAMPWESADAVLWVVDMDSWEVVDEIRMENLGISGFSIRDGYLYAAGYEWTKDSEMDKVVVMAFDVGGGLNEGSVFGEVTEIEWEAAPWLEEESQNEGFTTDDFEKMFNQTRNQTRPGGSGSNSNDAPFPAIPVVLLTLLMVWRTVVNGRRGDGRRPRC